MEKGLKFGVIGLGQAGGNIANEYAKLGYKTMVISTFQTDLELLDSIHKNNRLLNRFYKNNKSIGFSLPLDSLYGLGVEKKQLDLQKVNDEYIDDMLPKSKQ